MTQAHTLALLEICQLVYDAGDAGFKGMAAYSYFRGPAGNAAGLPLKNAEGCGLVESFRIAQGHRYFRLTDAGRFHLRTAITGPKAHSLLDEIGAEMAGQA